MNTTDIKSYHRLIQNFVAALNDKMAKISTVQGLSFQLDVPGSYPERTLSLNLRHASFKADLMDLQLHVYTNAGVEALTVEYRSSSDSGHGRRTVVVTGTVDQQTNKLAKRALIRFSEMQDMVAASRKERAAEKARQDQWNKDFVGADGKNLIPSEFARAWKVPGRYSINPNVSKVLGSDSWTKDEVLELVALLSKIRKNMVEEGRLENKPDTDEQN